MAKRQTKAISTKIRGPRKTSAAAKEIVNEFYAGERFDRIVSIGTATSEIVRSGTGTLLRIGRTEGDQAGYLETTIEAPIGGPLALSSVTVKIKGRKSQKDSASNLDIAVATDGSDFAWQSIALSKTLEQGEAIFTFTGDSRFATASIKIRPSDDGRSAVIQELEVVASGRPF